MNQHLLTCHLPLCPYQYWLMKARRVCVFQLIGLIWHYTDRMLLTGLNPSCLMQNFFIWLSVSGLATSCQTWRCDGGDLINVGRQIWIWVRYCRWTQGGLKPNLIRGLNFLGLALFRMQIHNVYITENFFDVWVRFKTFSFCYIKQCN